MRGARGTPFRDLGSFANLADAAHVIAQTEGNPTKSILFRVYVDPLFSPSDAEVLSRLEFQSAKRFYLLTRSAQ